MALVPHKKDEAGLKAYKAKLDAAKGSGAGAAAAKAKIKEENNVDIDGKSKIQQVEVVTPKKP